MISNIQIKHSISYDFIMSLIRIGNNGKMGDFFSAQEDLIDKIKFDENLQKWINNTSSQIPENYKKSIDKYFYSKMLFFKTFIYYIRYNDFSDVSSFINYISEIPPSELLAQFLYLYTSVNGSVKVDTIEEIRTILADSSAIASLVEKTTLLPEKKWAMLQICMNPETMKQEIIELFNWYNETIFDKEVVKIEKILKKREKELARKIDQYKEEYLTLLVKIDYKNYKKKRNVTIILSYFTDIGYIIFVMGDSGEDLYLLGYRHSEVYVERRHGVLSNVQIFKALGDETRQNMIKLLSQKEWYGDEMAQKMGLSNSTVSYHLNILLMEGFIKLNRVEKRSYFTLNKENMKKIIDCAVFRMIEGDSSNCTR